MFSHCGCSNSHRQYVSCRLYLRVSFTTPQGATKLAVTLRRHFEETSQKPALLQDMVGKIQLPWNLHLEMCLQFGLSVLTTQHRSVHFDLRPGLSHRGYVATIVGRAAAVPEISFGIVYWIPWKLEIHMPRSKLTPRLGARNATRCNPKLPSAIRRYSRTSR